MERVESRKIPLGELQPSEFREFLGPISDEDVLALKEDSFDRYNDFWMGIRAYEKNGNLHLLFGHRRIRALILKEGAGRELPVKVVRVTDEEKILLLGEAGWKNATDDERFGLVKLAAAFLIEYGEGNSTQVDIDLLKAGMLRHWQNVGSTRISNWLGKRLWPQPHIWKLIDAGKPREVLSEGVELLQAEKYESVEPMISSTSKDQVGHLELEDDPTQPINPASQFVCNGASVTTDAHSTEKDGQVLDVADAKSTIDQVFHGIKPVRAPKLAPDVLPPDPTEILYKTIESRKTGIQNDLDKKIIESDLRRRYVSALTEFLQQFYIGS